MHQMRFHWVAEKKIQFNGENEHSKIVCEISFGMKNSYVRWLIRCSDPKWSLSDQWKCICSKIYRSHDFNGPPIMCGRCSAVERTWNVNCTVLPVFSMIARQFVVQWSKNFNGFTLSSMFVFCNEIEIGDWTIFYAGKLFPFENALE